MVNKDSSARLPALAWKKRRANPVPDNPCGECKYYYMVHEITNSLSEGWCRVDPEAKLVLSEETCEKWEVN